MSAPSIAAAQPAALAGDALCGAAAAWRSCTRPAGHGGPMHADRHGNEWPALPGPGPDERAAYLNLPQPDADDPSVRPAVAQDTGRAYAAVRLGADVDMHIHSAAQARQLAAVFARAAELIEAGNAGAR